MAAPDTTELRGPCPKRVVGVLDAVSGARKLDRMQLVNEILLEWAKKRVHESTIVARVLRINPAEADSGWGDLE